MTSTPPTIVLVPGAASTAQVWGPLQRELALLGHRSCALDLPGHGTNARHPAGYYQSPQDLAAFATEPSALAGVRIADYADHVVGAVRRLAEHGPVILVGTSAGGFSITAVAEQVPELVDRLVYLSAWCAVGAETVGEFAEWPECGPSLAESVPWPRVGDPAELGVLRHNLRSADPEYFARAKAAMLADGTDDDFRALLNALEPDVNFLVGSEKCPVSAQRWGRVPRSYVRFTADRSIPLAAQDRMIREADGLAPWNPFRVHSIDSSHVGYYCRPAEFARLLDHIAC